MWRKAIICIAIIVSTGCISVHRTVIMDGTDKRIPIKDITLFNPRDRIIAEKSLILIGRIDSNQIYPFLPERLFWANLGKEYSGMTVGHLTKSIYIDRKTVLLDRNDPLEWLHFGALLSHELHHYFHDSSDPETGKITNEAIYKKIAQDEDLLRNYSRWWKEVKESR